MICVREGGGPLEVAGAAGGEGTWAEDMIDGGYNP
jgi:hypothetical protein